MVYLITLKETLIGYRGSKTVIDANGAITVKEQRVNDSWQKIKSNYFCLRCTLMGGMNRYQTGILSNQYNIEEKRLFTVGANQYRCYSSDIIEKADFKLNPAWVTGFVDGEGCFTISISKDKIKKIGWHVKLSFEIILHSKYKVLLEKIKNFFFDVGSITKNSLTKLHYRVQSINDLEVIIDHFDNFPLLTQKLADYKLFKQAYNLMLNKKYLTEEGLEKFVAIKASMNLGLSDQLKIAFPNISYIDRPLVQNKKIQDPNWLAGFTSAEGCFLLNIHESSSSRLGFRLKLIFQLTQHIRDEQLMKNLINYFEGSGDIYDNKGTAVDYRVSQFSDIQNKIIPFVKKYPVIGVKHEDFKDFVIVADMMKEKTYLTEKGLEQIRKIKAGMNTGRK